MVLLPKWPNVLVVHVNVPSCVLCGDAAKTQFFLGGKIHMLLEDKKTHGRLSEDCEPEMHELTCQRDA